MTAARLRQAPIALTFINFGFHVPTPQHWRNDLRGKSVRVWGTLRREEDKTESTNCVIVCRAVKYLSYIYINKTSATAPCLRWCSSSVLLYVHKDHKDC